MYMGTILRIDVICQYLRHSREIVCKADGRQLIACYKIINKGSMRLHVIGSFSA